MLAVVGAIQTLIATTSAVRWGSMAAAGVEVSLAANWSARLQCDYQDFGRKGVTFARLVGGTFTHEIKRTMPIVKAHIKHRFRGPLAKH